MSSDHSLTPERIEALLTGIAVGSDRTRSQFDADLERLGEAALSDEDHLTIMEADDLDGLEPSRAAHLDGCSYCQRLADTMYRSIDVTAFDRKLVEELAVPKRTAAKRLAVAAMMCVCFAGGLAFSGLPARASRLPEWSVRSIGSRKTLSLDSAKEHYFRTQVPYGRIIYDEATQNRLSPELVAALIQTDSDFRPRLVSHRNAQGLMQIVPETARLLGVEDPFDPEQNIAAGTRYLRYLFDVYSNEQIALAAYSSGEGTVAKYGGVPPFEETRAYLEKVAVRTARYRERVEQTYLAASNAQAVQR